MKKANILRDMLLVSVSTLLMTACSHKQPNVKKTNIKQPNVKKANIKQPKKLNVTLKEQEQVISSTKEEAWVPLKTEDEVEWNAKELLGLKYVWGATGPFNYDCSGFTQKIYGDLGIHLPRVSRDQAENGELVSFENLKKGDLVFFSTERRKPGQVTHVGIYLENNNFIHASSAAKKIVICNFEKDTFYKKHFLWGRRVIHSTQYVASTNEENSLKSAI